VNTFLKSGSVTGSGDEDADGIDGSDGVGVVDILKRKNFRNRNFDFLGGEAVSDCIGHYH
jgi:hypothetical protein